MITLKELLKGTKNKYVRIVFKHAILTYFLWGITLLVRIYEIVYANISWC